MERARGGVLCSYNEVGFKQCEYPAQCIPAVEQVDTVLAEEWRRIDQEICNKLHKTVNDAYKSIHELRERLIRCVVVCAEENRDMAARGPDEPDHAGWTLSEKEKMAKALEGYGHKPKAIPQDKTRKAMTVDGSVSVTSGGTVAEEVTIHPTIGVTVNPFLLEGWNRVQDALPYAKEVARERELSLLLYDVTKRKPGAPTASSKHKRR
jgi:hypothetical protein